MQKALGRVAVCFLFLVSALVLLVSVTTFPETGAGGRPAVGPTVIPTVIPYVTVTVYVPVTMYVPVYQTLTQTVQVSVTASATVTSVATSVTTTSQLNTFSQSVTQWNTVTSVTTAVGVLGPWVNSIFKQYSDLGMIAVGLVIGTTAVCLLLSQASQSLRAEFLKLGIEDPARSPATEGEMSGLVRTVRQQAIAEEQAREQEQLKKLQAAQDAASNFSKFISQLPVIMFVVWVILILVLLLSLLSGVSCFWC